MGKDPRAAKRVQYHIARRISLQYAQVALAADSTRIALESVTRYLSATGDEGEFYKEALALLLRAERHEVLSAENFYNEVIKTEGTCKGCRKARVVGWN